MATKNDILSQIIALPEPRPEEELVWGFLANPALDEKQRGEAKELAAGMVTLVREKDKGGPVERLMAGYNLTSEEGRSLMALAESLLRVPDERTRDALIEDRVVGHHWFARDADGLVKAAGLALDAADYLIKDDHGSVLHAMAHRLGMPVIRSSIIAGMHLLGKQFVKAETIEDAVEDAMESPSVMYSFDMLGEGARTEEDAKRYLASYEKAIKAVAGNAVGVGDPKLNNGVSVKLSALHCRYRTRCWNDVNEVLLPRILHLCKLAKEGNIPLAIDAEEAARLEMSLTLVSEIMATAGLAGWNGLGVVVQGYGRRAGEAIDALLDIVERTGQDLSVRLVKGAYWDTEIKTAQVKGLEDFPVYSRKVHTDLSYLAMARRLLESGEKIYPQFATHNAVTLAALEMMFREQGGNRFEVQKLHGMGDAVHGAYLARCSRHVRVYAPVGSQDDLLAYLVRRLLENAANASFLHQLNDEGILVDELVKDPYELAQGLDKVALRTGAGLFGDERANSQGWDLDRIPVLQDIAAGFPEEEMPRPPAEAGKAEAAETFEKARAATEKWTGLGFAKRASIIEAIGDRYEKNARRLIWMMAKEAGKTHDDAVAEVREAVDFCRYYAARARRLADGVKPRGVVLAISPWNFPLAIFTGQIAAALVVGNAVVAKPAEQTPCIAKIAVDLMHEAGVPGDALQLLCGDGETLGAHLAGCGEADMVVFTGSTDTAQSINKAIASSSKPAAPLLAETGGINAMVVDSTALPERVVDDVVESAFRSAGQRCSSLRMLYVQEEVLDKVVSMLTGAGELLKVADPAELDTDIGPVIDGTAKAMVDEHVAKAKGNGRLVWQGAAKGEGNYCAPAIIRVDGIADVEREVFGPVLHVAPYPSGGEERIIKDINATGYGLTLGIHSRVQARQELLAGMASVGNVYVNRNQIGAVVGSQPFGGVGLSGTGPKAGGPLYLNAFTKNAKVDRALLDAGKTILAGPDGEENIYLVRHKDQVVEVAELDDKGGWAGTVSGAMAIDARKLDPAQAARLRRELAGSGGRIVPVVTDAGGECWLYEEKTRCTDTTASGGNISLFSLGA